MIDNMTHIVINGRPYMRALGKIKDSDIVIGHGHARLVVEFQFGSSTHQSMVFGPNRTGEVLEIFGLESLKKLKNLACYALYASPYVFNSLIIGIKVLEHDGEGVFLV